MMSATRAAAPLAGRSSPLEIPAWALILLGILWLVFLGGGFFGVYGSELRTVSVVLTAFALGTWGMVALVWPTWRPRSAIWPALAIPLAAFAVTTLTSERPRVSAEYLGYALLLAALYLLLRALMAHPRFRDRIAALTVFLAVLVGGWYLIANVGHWLAWWEAVGGLAVPPLRPRFENLTFGNPSAVMTMSVLLTAAAVAHLGGDGRLGRSVIIVLVALAVAVTLISGSRAGWLAAALAVGVTGIAALLSPGGRRAVAGLVRARAARLALVGMLVAEAIVAVVLGPGILLRATAGGEALRGTYLAVAARQFAAAPITGLGAGTWPADRIRLTADDETDYYIPHAHNVYVQTAGEHGLLGLLAGAIAIGCLAWLVIGGLRDPDRARRRWGWAALFATVYFGAHNVLDFYANMPAALFAFAIPIAWLDGTARRSITAGVRWPAMSPLGRRVGAAVGAIAAVIVLGIAAAGLLAQEPAAQRLALARTASSTEEWAAVLPGLREADEAEPDIPAYAFGRGLAEAHVGDRAAALAALQRVAMLDDLPVAWLDVAALRLDGGDKPGARDALGRALRLGHQQGGVLFAAGLLYERLGDETASNDAYSAALRLLPSLAGDPWWSADERAARWPAIRDGALASMAPEQAADLLLSAGDTAGAWAAAAGIEDEAARERTELAIAAWDGGPAERSMLEAWVAAHPLDVHGAAWAGRIAARAGDERAVAGYRLWADMVYAGRWDYTGEVRVADTAPPAESILGLSGQYWGRFAYRRLTPHDQLVPALPALVLAPSR